MGDLTIAELRNMTATEREAHAAAQRQRLVMARIPETGRVTRDDLVHQMHGWMGAGQIDMTIDELIGAHQVNGLSGKGGYVQRTEGGAS